MIRVLFLHRDISCTSGVTRCILTFAQHAQHDEMDVRLGCFCPPTQEMAERVDGLKLPSFCLGDRSGVAAMLRLRRYLKNEKIHVIVACSFKSYMCAKLAATGLKCGVVFWVHGVQKTITGRLRGALFAWMSRRDTLLFVSEAVRRAKLPFNHAGHSSVVYNGVPDAFDDPAQTPYPRSRRSAFGLTDDMFIIGYVAEMVPWKDHETLIRAFEALAQGEHAVPAANLLLVGTGMMERDIMERVEASPLHDRIHLLGARSDARRLLGLVDVCAHPAHEEGFGLVVVEAMLADRPIVVASSGALPEYVKDGITGKLFAPGDAPALAKQLRWVHDHPDQANSMAAEARRRCQVLFSPMRFAKEIASVITGAARGSHRLLIESDASNAAPSTKNARLYKRASA